MSNIVNEEVKLIAVDCFCGAGGESEGLEQAVNENGKNKWLPVRDCLELEKEGDSIFDRKKPLSPNTIDRITSGGIRFVGGGRKNYEPIKMGIKTKVLPAYDEAFLSKAYSGDPYSKNVDLDNPSGSITCKDHHQLIKADFMTVFYGNGFNADLNEPCPTATTKDRFAVVSSYIVNSYTGGGQLTGLDSACPAIMTTPKQNLLHLKSRKWLLNTQFGNDGGSIDNPCFTLIARMDKKPPSIVTMDRNISELPSFVTVLGDTVHYVIYPEDDASIVELKMFMATYGILDIKMRMLYVSELLRIMGFPESYELIGNQTDQKKFIGNAVEVKQARANAKAVAKTIGKTSKLALNKAKLNKAIL